MRKIKTEVKYSSFTEFEGSNGEETSEVVWASLSRLIVRASLLFNACHRHVLIILVIILAIIVPTEDR